MIEYVLVAITQLCSIYPNEPHCHEWMVQCYAAERFRSNHFADDCIIENCIENYPDWEGGH